jgi:hypothetical protein
MRNVRPSWIRVSKDDTGNFPSIVKETGPRGRSGTLSAVFLTRELARPRTIVTVDAIASADGATVLWRIVADGVTVFERRVEQ